MSFSTVFLASPVQAAPRDIQIRSVDFQTGVVELFNFGETDQDLSGWRWCSHDDLAVLLYSSGEGLNGVTIEAGTSLWTHLNNDAPAEDPDHLNQSVVGDFAGPLDTGPYSLQIYYPPTKGSLRFGNGDLIADHLQWNLDGADDPSGVNGRSVEAVEGGTWSAGDAWIATTSESTGVVLLDETGGTLHGPENYAVTEPDPRRAVQIRSVNLTTGIVELFNFGETDQDLSGWRWCSHDDLAVKLYSSGEGLNGVTIEAGTSLWTHLNNDAPADDPDHLNQSVVGDFAGPLDTGPYSLQIYYPPTDGGRLRFGNGDLIADHLQWNLDGADDPSGVDGRSEEAVEGGTWSAGDAWIATTAESTGVVLLDETGGTLHGPESYEVTSGAPDPRPQFRRGDTDDTGSLEITDAVRVFSFLFLGTEGPRCLETADSNNDATLDISDGIGVLTFLFQGGNPPVTPGPDSCGSDPDEADSAGDLGCNAYTSC